MKLQLQPNSWSCLPTAFAIVLDIEIKEIFKLIGHDGSEIIWPDYQDPYKRRSFHVQELILVAFNLGFNITPFEQLPLQLPSPLSEQYYNSMPDRDLTKIMFGKKGVITGTSKTNSRHAVAWNGFKIYDPNHSIYDVDQFIIEEFYLVR